MDENAPVIDAVVFDLDGVLLDSEQVWDEVRREVVAAHHGRWPEGATEAMQGMSAPEWSAHLAASAGTGLDAARLEADVLARLLARYRRRLPLIPGAAAAVGRLGDEWPLALASSSNRPVIEAVLELAGLAGAFRVTVSSEEVRRGKPSPDVYLEAADRLGVAPTACAAVEDSANGIRAALAAGACVLAVPNPHFPPPTDLLAAAHGTLGSLEELTAAAVHRADSRRHRRAEAHVDEESSESFPASDAPADWAGPPT